jgi:hypothetical protein
MDVLTFIVFMSIIWPFWYLVYRVYTTVAGVIETRQFDFDAIETLISSAKYMTKYY